MNQLTKIINKAHENAVKRGVYDCKDCEGTGKLITYNHKEVTSTYCYVCKGTRKASQKNIIAKLWEEVSELEKAFDENKESSKAYLEYHVEHDDVKFIPEFEKYIKSTLGDELADIILVCLAASKELNIPIIEHLIAKNKYNEVRNE